MRILDQEGTLVLSIHPSHQNLSEMTEKMHVLKEQTHKSTRKQEKIKLADQKLPGIPGRQKADGEDWFEAGGISKVFPLSGKHLKITRKTRNKNTCSTGSTARRWQKPPP